MIRSTAAGYESAVNSYLSWAEAVGVAPWPIDETRMASYVVDSATHLKIESIDSYMSALKFMQPQYTGHPWTLDDSVVVRQARRYVKREFGMAGKGSKYPVCLRSLRLMLPHLAGWPVAEVMSHDDRLFACASLVATMAFLRGGEFLFSPKSARPVLLGKDVSLRLVNGVSTVVVAIPSPKNAWWESHLDAYCFPIEGRGEFCPRHRLEVYRRCSTIPLGELEPAFRMADGSPLSRDWMVSRTAALAGLAGLYGIDGLGQRTKVKASSWRAGGVRSATDAGLAGPVIMALGRWKSLAWAAYALYDIRDLRSAATSMWVGSSENAQGVAECLQQRAVNTRPFTAELEVAGLEQCLRAAGHRQCA